jgi:hypothetical protein
MELVHVYKSRLHLVNKVNPSSFTLEMWNDGIEFPWNSLRNDKNVDWIGAIISCNETSLLTLSDRDWKIESVHMYKPCTSLGQ